MTEYSLLETMVLMEKANAAGARISYENGELLIQIAKNKKLDQVLLAELKAGKEQLTQYFRNHQSEQSASQKLRTYDRTMQKPVPLSYNQERLWFIDQFEGSANYHMYAVLRLTGSLNVYGLENAFVRIVNRHEVLRTLIKQENGAAFQDIQSPGNWKLNIIAGQQYKDDEKGLKALVDELLYKPFDLASDPMLRGFLIQLSEQDFVLLIVLHHIAGDGWSVSVIVKELVECYAAHLHEREPRLPALPLQYADFALWQREYLAGSAFKSDISYWKEKLKSTDDIILPVDFSRPTIKTARGSYKEFQLEKRVVEQLHTLSRQNGCTLFMTLLAAFKVLLFRHSRQKDICVGTVVANRQQWELEALVGLFVNTLALRSTLDEDISFIDFLQQVKETTLEAFEHQNAPFDKVVDAVMKHRDVSRNPLVQVMFVLQNTPDVPKLQLGGISLAAMPVEDTTSKFDLLFSLAENNAGINGRLEYNSDLFTGETIDHVLNLYEGVLLAVIKNPAASIKTIPLLSDSRQQQLLSTIQSKKEGYPADKTIIDLFCEQAYNTPDHIALQYEKQRITYRDLDHRSTQLAHYLKNQGVAVETLVPLCMSNSVNMIVGMLAILKAGGAYVPMDPDYPQERISFMLRDTKAEVVVADEQSMNAIPAEWQAKLVVLEREMENILDQPATPVMADIHPGSAAYVIYTSGSTGTPKGVIVEHGNVVRLFITDTPLYDFSASDVWTMFHSFCFDFSVWEIYGALFYGGRLIIIPREVTRDFIRFGQLLSTEGVTVLNQTPGAFHALQEVLINSNIPLQLRYVIFGGEQLSPAMLKPWKKKYPGCQLINMYGITETTVHVTYKEITERDMDLGLSNIGKPIPTLECFIMDDNRLLLPTGIAGELYVGGAGVARGYLNRPGLTEERFINHPYGNGRLYRTGDMGRWRPDGNIEYLGRIDDQVKIRGYRIEIGEIENALQRTGAISKAVVLAKKDNQTNSLLAFYVPDGAIVRTKEEKLADKYIEDWRAVYEEEYGKKRDLPVDAAQFDIIGWNDSFTGLPIPAIEMQLWLEDITALIIGLQPERVLEIGCGTGMIYHRLTPHVKKYIGADFSKACIDQIRAVIDKSNGYPDTQLMVTRAHDIAISPDEQIDTIILNSVIQYFPSADYLLNILDNAISHLKGKGKIVVGDVRDYRLLKHFVYRKISNDIGNDLSLKELIWKINLEMLQETELCLSPEFFYRLSLRYPEITHIEVQWKQGDFINELSLYRYTVVIYVGCQEEYLQPDWLLWDSHTDGNAIVNAFNSSADVIAVQGMPNPRLWREQDFERASNDKAIITHGDLETAIAAPGAHVTVINNILHIAKQKGYKCSMLLHHDPLKMNLVLTRNPDRPGFIKPLFEINSNIDVPVANIPLYPRITELIEEDLRHAMAEQLPDYMIPSGFTALSYLPLTSNGKTDRKLLASMHTINRHSGGITYVAPTGEREKILISVCEEVLRRQPIGMLDDFYELGGDSIKSIQVVSRLRQRGLYLDVKDVLMYPQFKILCERLRNTYRQIGQEPVSGAVLPGSIQLAFFSRHYKHYEHFNQAVLLESHIALTPTALKAVLAKIVQHHDALRMVYSRQPNGKWQQENLGLEQEYGLHIYDMRGQQDWESLMLQACEKIQSGINLRTGPLLHAGLFVFDNVCRILLVVHHLVIDGVSWRILFEDLSILMGQFERGEILQLPQKSDSFQFWQQQVHAYSQSEVLKQEHAYWSLQERRDAVRIPLDIPDGSNLYADERTEHFVLSESVTRQLQSSCHQVYGTDINDLLVCALGLCFYEVFGIKELLLRLEGHGREPIGSEVDITRTLGWFTSEYPVLLQRADVQDVLSYLITVKEQLHHVPNKGLGYGILRYISDNNIREGLTYSKDPEVTFNYLGDFGTGIENRQGERYFTFSRYPSGSPVNKEEQREELLLVQGIVVEGRLRISVSYSSSQFKAATMRRLMNSYGQHLEQLITRLAGMKVQYKTPIDLTYQGLRIAELEALNLSGVVDDVYELTPLQQGMYYHWLSSPSATTYFEQIVYRVEGELDHSSLEHGYKQVVARHDALRTSFTTQYGGIPLQVVRRETVPDFTFMDVSNDNRFNLESFAASDRSKGFRLENGSQMRLSVLKTGEREYTFLWSHHHILMDGWCTSIVIKEFYLLYYGHRQGRLVELPPAVPYREYIKWLRKTDHRTALDYWRSYLSDYHTAARLPIHVATSAVGKGYAEKEIVIDPLLTKQLRKLCMQLAITENSFMQTVWGILLSKYNNTRDVVFGGVVSGRPADLAGVEDMVGLFINTVPVRIRYEADTTVQKLLLQVQQDNINGLSAHHVQLGEIQAESSLGSNLIDHILVFENYPVQNMVRKEMEERFELKIRSTDFYGSNSYNLTILIVSDEEMKIQLKYDTSLYTDAFIHNVAVNLEETFFNILRYPSELVKNVMCLNANEQEKLLSFPREKFSEHVNVVTRFQQLAEQMPESRAVIAANGKLTYGELNRLANQFCGFLVKQYGVEKGNFIGIRVNSADKWLVVAILAVIKSGAAFLPLHGDTDNARFKVIIEDAGCKLIIDQEVIDGFEKDAAGYSSENPRIPITGTDTCYVMYTSGTTGRPKGVMIEHQALLNYVQAISAISGIGVQDSSVITSSYAFDLIYTSLFGTVFNGGAIHLVDEEVVKMPQRLADYIIRERVTYLKVTPTLFNLLVNHSNIDQLLGASSLRLIFLGGESPLLSNIKLIRNYPHIRLFNHYGPTETTIGVCVHEITDDNLSLFLSQPVIGKPFPNNYIYILDRDHQMMPLGATGEICIGGIGVSKGYWQKEELTQIKFREDVWQPDNRIYCTGDLGKQLEDGTIVFLGRMDDQVKIRGYRVEPAEIEEAIRAIKEVEEVVVLARNIDGQQELVAYWLGEPATTGALLRNELRRSLPVYMIPAFFVRVDYFPITGNGKLDRSLLPQPEQYEFLGEAYIAPVTEREQALIHICEEVLRRKPIGMLDDFFILGGDSIKSIQVVSRLRQLGYYLEVKDVLMYPQFKELGTHLRLNERQISQAQVSGPVLLGAIQHSFFCRGYKNFGHYNQAVLLDSKIPLTAEAVNAVLDKIVAHHDALRMVYHRDENGKWSQENAAMQPGYHLYTYDLRGYPDWETQLRGECQRIQESMDLFTGRLIQAGLFICDDRTRILLAIHHLAVDGVSWRIIFEDLSILFKQYEANESFILPQKSDSFQYWQQQVLHYSVSEQLRREHNYWSQVENRLIKPLPADDPHGSNTYEYERSTHFVLSSELTQKLQGPCHLAYGTDINDILITALGLALYEVWGVQELLLRLEGHGREPIGCLVDISRTVGWFTSEYPVLLEMQPSDMDSNIRYLVNVKEKLHRVPNKGLGYGILRYISTDDMRDGLPYEKNPEVTFNYLGDFGAGIENAAGESLFEFSKYGTGSTLSKQEPRDELLSVQGMVVGGQLRISISYSKCQYNDATINRLVDSYGANLQKLISVLCNQDKQQKTPVDLTYQGLSIRELESIDRFGEVEDVYELSPLQLGMYYHWLSDRSSPAYFEQLVYEVTGGLDLKALEDAYYFVIAKHAILRTGFTHAHGLPLQIVRRNVRQGFLYRDVSGEQQFSVSAFVTADRMNGFDLAGNSQMRLTVLRTGADSYTFIWCNHHIVMDGWCTGIIINDFFQAYNNYRAGKQLPSGKVYPYSSYIRWLLKVDQDASFQYWNKYLLGYLTKAGVPVMKSGKAVARHMKQKGIGLDMQVAGRIRILCSELGITENSFFQAAWGILLSKYNNTTDAVFGGVVSGRPAELEGVEKMIGLFINTVPVRVRYKVDTLVSELLKSLQVENIEGMNHHYIQLAQIQSQHPLGTELFDTVFIFENYPVGEMVATTGREQGKSFKIQSSELFAEINYPISIVILPGAQPQVNILFNAGLYADVFIERLLAHFSELIIKMASDPSQAVATLPYMTDAEKQQLWQYSNGRKFEYPLNRTIPQLFSKQVAERPDAAAVVFEDTLLTYKELDQLSDSLAGYLMEEYKLKPGSKVGAKLKRSEWAVITMLGILKAGCVYVPIDPAYPEYRMAYMEQDSGCSVLLDERLISSFKGWLKVSAGRKTGDVQLTSADLAYVLYTSGSTGVPKGVMIEHGTVINTLLNTRDILGITEDDRGLQFSSLSFDSSISEIFMVLLAGATLHIVNEEVKADPVKLKEYIRSNQVTVASLPPVYLKMMDIEKEDGLRKLISMGEAAVKNVARDFSRFGKFFNGYGPTEASIAATIHYIPAEDITEDLEVLPIGRPFANAEMLLLDDALQLVPIGVIGEIFIGGAGLSRGYLNKPDLTAEKFIEHPYKKGERLYRTGDLGRRKEDGNVEFMGRKDDQVKLRGQRIELSEIETVLRAYKGITDALVILKEEPAGDKYLAAYIVSPEKENQVSFREIRTYLLTKLPAYMVPSAFCVLERLPVTPNGKLDRKALPEPYNEQDAEQAIILTPLTEPEKILVQVCAEMLRRTGIGMQDDFFELGGDSIKSIQLVARMRQLGYHLQVRDVLAHPVLKNMAHYIKKGGRSIYQGQVTGDTLPGPIQIAYLQNDQPDKHHFNQSVLLRSAERLNMEGIQAVLAAIISHHDALRMVFSFDGNNWIQRNLGSEQGYGFTVKDVRQCSDWSEQMVQYCKELQEGFSLSHGPLFHAGVFHCPDGDRLLLLAHHLVVDGVSWRILLADLRILYEQYLAGHAMKLPDKTDSFQFWMLQQHQFALSPALLSEIPYWKNITEKKVLPLPADDPGGSNLFADEHTRSFRLGKELTYLLQTRCHKAYNTDTNDILLTALGLAIKQTLSSDLFLVQLEGHGREHIGADLDVTRTIGWFTSVYPVLIDVSGQYAAIHYLKNIKENLHRIPNKGIGFGILRHITPSSIHGGFSYNIPPAITFNYLGDFDEVAEDSQEKPISLFKLSGKPHGSAVSDKQSRGTQLNVSGIIVNDELRLSVSFSCKQYKDTTISRLQDAYRTILQELINHLVQAQKQLTPVDLTYRELKPDQLYAFPSHDNIEDIYELTPFQQDLYQLWKHGQAPQIYFLQLAYDVKGNLDSNALQQSYNSIVSRHASLRTNFTGHFGLPLQIVHKTIPDGFRYMDVRGDDRFDLQRFLETDRNAGFDLENGSPVRLTAIRAGDASYYFVWSMHHIIIDGWCSSIIVNEFYNTYYTLTSGRAPVHSKQLFFSDYIKWLSARDKTAEMSHWKTYLQGYEIPGIGQLKIGVEPNAWDEQEAHLETGIHLSRKIRNLCASLSITENAMLQTIWGLLLGKWRSTDDVVFGAIVSGRPEHLEGVESMLGAFINTIPVRVRYDGSVLSDFMKKMHSNNVTGTSFQHVDLAELEEQCGYRQSLVDHIFVFENYPVQNLVKENMNKEERTQHMEARSFEFFEVNRYPLTVTIFSTDTIFIKFKYKNELSRELISLFITYFEKMLTAVVDNPSLTADKYDSLKDFEKAIRTIYQEG